MQTSQYNTSITRKTDELFMVNITDEVALEAGVHTVFFTIRNTVPNLSINDDDDANVVLKKTVTQTAGVGVTTLNFNIELSDDETNIKTRNYYYDVKWKTPAGKIIGVVPISLLAVVDDITRRIT